jgi:hypothetical protein
MDSKEKRYIIDIARMLRSKTTDALGGSELTAKKTTTLDEIKKRVDGADHDETRVQRALNHMIHDGAIERSGFQYVTTPHFTAWMRDIQD